MNYRYIVSLILIVSTLVWQAYTHHVWTYRDAKVLERVDQIVQEYIKEDNKERLISMLATIKNWSWALQDNEGDAYLLEQVEKRLQAGITYLWTANESDAEVKVRDFLLEKNPDKIDETLVVEEIEEIAVEVIEIEEEIVEKPKPVPVVSETVLVNTPPTPLKTMSKQEFYNTYAWFLLDTSPMSSRCYTYFDQIDAIAEKYDFPTAMIIATWHREHSCYFKNPDNWRGNFQITTNDYPAGEITWADLSRQIVDFIEFSKGKRWYYDNIQVFWPEPVSLKYNAFDLSSIRKQSILYNWVYPEVRLDNSWYANENFTQARWWRDGIVAAFIKVVGWELDNK